MSVATYLERRSELKTYFDRTAADAWARLTSDAPVSRIRATVRAGRDEMRGRLLSWLPENLSGARLLDAGCGTGALAVEAARRGARVVAIDLSPTLIEVARQRIPQDIDPAALNFVAGDMLDPVHGHFDYVVAMDSLIHYRLADAARVTAGLAARAGSGVLFTFAPRTPALTVMHAVGRLFPRGERAPAIEPVSETRLRRVLAEDEAFEGWRTGRAHRVNSHFYQAQALELVPR
jgi:magnesium-protoporphyrin O-methyltransferase